MGSFFSNITMPLIQKTHSLIAKGHNLCTDSRKVQANDIFIALKGDNFDGNAYAQSALDKGAAIAICDDPALSGTPGIEIVPNALTFLQELAQWHRDTLAIPIIGLTGTNGKTTTKELLRAVLATRFHVYATEGNLNNHIGVPLSILSITPRHQMAIIEMGANHVGEIDFLCSISKPTHGLITNVGKAHLEGFGSFEGVKKAKSELYQYLSEHKGVVFFNEQNSILKELVAKFTFTNTIAYGTTKQGMESIPQHANFLELSISYNGQKVRLNTQMVGEYNMENIAAALSVGCYFGTDFEQSLKTIEGYTPTNNRSQIIESERNTIILDAYNANPSSMEVALNNFSLLKTGKKKVIILGEMLELGEYAPQEHKRIYQLANQAGELLITVGSSYQPYNLKPNLWFGTTQELKEFLYHNPLNDCVLLIKGSRGMQLEKLVDVV